MANKVTVTPTFELKDDEDVRKFLLGLLRDIRKGEVDMEMAHSINEITDKYIKHKIAVVLEENMKKKMFKTSKEINKQLMQKTD